MFLGAKRPPTVIRRVSVPVKQTDRKPGAPRPAGSRPPSNPSSNGSLQKKADSVKGSRVHKSSVASRPRSKASPAPHRARVVKRKAPSPGVQHFSSGSEDDSEDEGIDLTTTKRARTNGHDSLEPDLKRKTFSVTPWTAEDSEKWPIRNGADLTTGQYAKEYRAVFESGDTGAFVELQYPSNCPTERFELVAAIESQGYEAFDDVIQTVEHVCRYYFSESEGAILMDDVTGYSRRLKRAANISLDSFTAVLRDFNDMVMQHVSDGTIAQTLKNVHFLPLSLVERILSQTYSRTVSPKVNLLKQYENGTDNVYGELLPRFSHTIFSETQLRSDQVFVDLGSGVGNVVLQAALEVGCESWGIEKMPNPASLGTEQLKEFNARCKRYSIIPGKAHLIEGDFLACTEIDNALRRADVVLINNQAFTPELNNKIVMKLLDLKEGCHIISLKSFVPHNWDIKPRNVEDPRNLLRVTKKSYWSDSVSWTNAGGEYFIATKDSMKLRNFLEKRR